MRPIYNIMGLCPQHDLLWATLSGREHLRFYGALKGMSGESRALVTGVGISL
jgi:ABC-type multidrug transport system ATPase subunit